MYQALAQLCLNVSITTKERIIFKKDAISELWISHLSNMSRE